MTIKLIALTAVLALAGTAAAHAADAGGTIQVSLTIVPKCSTLSGADAKSGEVETRCTAGDFAQIQENTERPKDATFAAFTQDEGERQVITVSF